MSGLTLFVCLAMQTAYGQAPPTRVLESLPGGNVVTASGTWVEVSDKKVPNSVVQIQCAKAAKTCDSASAAVVNGRASLDVGQLEILKWDSVEIVARTKIGSHLGCGTDTLTIDFRSQAVTMTMVPNTPPEKSCSELFGNYKTQTYMLRATRSPHLADREP